MKIDLISSAAQRPAADIAILPFWEGPHEAADLTPWREQILPTLELGDFKGKHAEALWITGRGKEPRILLLGLGKPEALTVECLRKVAAGVVKLKRGTKANWLLPDFKALPREAALQGVFEGLLLTAYTYTTYKKADPMVTSVALIGAGPQAKGILDHVTAIVRGVDFVRDLVNGNADEVTPEHLAKQATALGKKTLKTTLFNRKRLEEKGFGLITAVGRAAEVEPYLIQVDYSGNPRSKERIVLVGKGVTYDTGGLSLKPTDSMLTMKCDMAGGATVLGAIQVVADLGLKVNVTALVPTAENAIGSGSYKLGDVYRAYNGKTVEINNTDAEGRLLLADALAYAVKELKPSLIVDLATLTGAAVVALGEDIAALFTAHESLSSALLAASETTGEPLCRLPLWDSYLESFKSEIADLVNSGGREAGAVKAALFLQEFVGKEIPWAHLDIAGPAYLTKPKHYHSTRATGYGVRLLVDLIARQGS